VDGKSLRTFTLARSAPSLSEVGQKTGNDQLISTVEGKPLACMDRPFITFTILVATCVFAVCLVRKHYEEDSFVNAGYGYQDRLGFGQCMALAPTYDVGWCTHRDGGGSCVRGNLNGPDLPYTRCTNWLFAGRCMWGPGCRDANPVSPATCERNDPYHHPSPYNYRSCDSCRPWRRGHCGV
jgi:hypothetical protein